MPFVGLLSDERIESFALSGDEWAELRRTYRTRGLTMTCGWPGVPKRSKYGLQFFAHASGVECVAHAGASETIQHLTAKRMIAEVGRSRGWQATIEHPAPDRSWVADVLLEMGDRRLIVEVQWSVQQSHEFVRRQRRYEDAGYECLWIVAPNNIANALEVPAHEFRDVDGELFLFAPDTLHGPKTEVQFAEGVGEVLDGELRGRVELRAETLWVSTTERPCWQCKQPMTQWCLAAVDVKSRCGQWAQVRRCTYSLWQSNRPEVGVQKAILAELSKGGMASPTRYSWKTSASVPDGYQAQSCPHCNVLQGDNFLSNWDIWDESDSRFGTEPRTVLVPVAFPHVILFRDQVLATPHRCQDEGHGQCNFVEGSESGFPGDSEYSFEVYDPEAVRRRAEKERLRRERAAIEAERRALQQELERKKAYSQVQRERRIHLQQRESLEKWGGSDDQRALLTLFPDGFPDWLQHIPTYSRQENEVLLITAPIVWQSCLYLRHIHDLTPGFEIMLDTLWRELNLLTRAERDTNAYAIDSWLRKLSTEGLVREEYGGRWKKWVRRGIPVRKVIPEPDLREKALRALRVGSSAAGPITTEDEVGAQNDVRIDMRKNLGSKSRGLFQCKACGLNLDPILGQGGFHIGCGPSSRT